MLPQVPETSEPLPTVPIPSSDALSRGRALAEVVLCSGYPTQILVAGALASIGIRPAPDGTLSPTFVFALSGLDTVLLLGLVWACLRLSNEPVRELIVGTRPPRTELALGLLVVPALLVSVLAVQLGLRVVAPSLHNVAHSPFEGLLASRWLLAGFIALLVIAGGIREEIQRVFLLHRFEQRLGGGGVGLLVTSVAFGLGHALQGWDASLATGLLGALWGAIYLARRSAIATITSHAVFNIAQVLLGYAVVAR